MAAMIFWQKIFRDLSVFDAARRARKEAQESGMHVVALRAYAQPTLFEGKDDAYVEMEVTRATKQKQI